MRATDEQGNRLRQLGNSWLQMSHLKKKIRSGLDGGRRKLDHNDIRDYDKELDRSLPVQLEPSLQVDCASDRGGQLELKRGAFSCASCGNEPMSAPEEQVRWTHEDRKSSDNDYRSLTCHTNEQIRWPNDRTNYPLSYMRMRKPNVNKQDPRLRLQTAEEESIVGDEKLITQDKGENKLLEQKLPLTRLSKVKLGGRSAKPIVIIANYLPVVLAISLVLLITSPSMFNLIGQRSSLVLEASAYQLTNNLIANNLPPKFITSSMGQASNSEIVVRVKEGAASIGKLIYTLRGEDPDEDPLSFGVLGSMASDLLRIENVPGNLANVYLRKELDRETTESYQVVITLTDGKLGRGNWITKSMLIIVEDVNDNYPVFGPHRTAISIREDVKVPLIIETIEATDQDEGRFGQVIYKLDTESEDQLISSGGSQAGNNNSPSHRQSVANVFSIETIEGRGVISLISPLDYEQRALYQLRILAVDRAIEHERLTASTSILISVEDCEDQAPMFTFVPSITRIPENLPIGSPVVRVAAVDGDRGINNQIQYKLVAVNGQESGQERDLFAINSDSGQIIVNRELDRESSFSSDQLGGLWSSSASAGSGSKATSSQPGSYVLQIRASELGGGSSAAQTEVSTELTVILTDVNDELPTFSSPIYFGEILENSAPESLVTFIASSPISAGNDQVPVNSAEQQQPVVAKVTDRDQGTNGTFSLHLEGEHSHLFDIWPREATNEATFMIKVSGSVESQLDFERVKSFQFQVVAKEKFNQQQLRYNVAQMTVYLKDSNDNYPQFESELYRVEIPENAIRGMHICAVKATDLDSGLYGSQGVRYTEIRGEKANKFKLDPVTGVVTLKTNEHGFDRETIGQHHLIVEARDSNGSGNRNTTQLLIILTDVNDQKPKFLLDQYEAFIYENELDFQSPLQVQAVDNDAQNSANSRISYSIVAGDPQQNFTIDPQTGRIRVRSSLVLPTASATGNSMGDGEMPLETGGGQQVVAGGLDFERIAQKRDDTRQFNLTIRATDSGLPESLHDQTQVIILVYDKNDHAPVFSRNIYAKSVKEDAKEGSQVIQVLAQDGDHSPTNSKITYRISSGASDKFVIDSDSGLITVANGANLDIDRAIGGQKRTNYLLNVLASDGSFGPNQKSASALVNITIIDVNNKAPEFVTLGASRWPATTGTGALATTQLPAGNQQQQPQLMVVYVNEDAPYGLVVTRVVATDLDSSAELRYSINYARSEARNEDMALVEPSLIRDLFSIEPIEGTIKVSKQLDRELFDQVKLRLQVEDIAAQTPDQVAHSYLLIRITDVNDNRPTFKRPIYKAVVNENSISGTSVITLQADDRDLNKTLRYSLEGSPEMMRLVRINPRSGEVTVNDKIDRELYPMINVTVRAEDYGHPHSLTGSSQLLITVRDENDNNPVFLSTLQHNHNEQPPEVGDYRNHNMAGASDIHRSRSLAHAGDHAPEEERHSPQLQLLSPGSSAKISEDAPIGHQVAFVRAEDADVGNNGRVTYLIDGASSGGKFRIDRDSGIISVAASLDRETNRQYSLIIEACDNYDLGYSTGESRRVFTQVNVQLSDTNDNAPVLTTNLRPSSGNGVGAVTSNAVGGEHPLAGGNIAAAVAYPNQDDVMSSQGPYEVPLSDCLFINEFQPLNEPILTITATDADDPSTGNGQMDLTIVNNNNNSNQSEPLFRLVAINQQQQAAASGSSHLDNQPPTITTAATLTSSDDHSGFGPDLALDESSLASSIAQTPGKSRHTRSAVTIQRPPMSGHLQSPRRQQQSLLVAARSLSRPQSVTETPPIVSATMASVRRSVARDGPEASGEQQVHVVVSQSLKERVGNYSILVRAMDRGQPNQLSSLKQINICVLDVNNHSPVFSRPPLNHTIRIMENATIGTHVTQVEATDLDHGLNGELQYSLKQTVNNQHDWQSFRIDRLTGVITTAKLFNRQLKKYYTLRVQAQDFGRPTSLSSDIDINIMIVNSGHYQPEFDNQLQTLQFTENVTPGTEWFTLSNTNNQDDDPALINLSPATETTTMQSAQENRSVAGRQSAGSSWQASPCYFIVDSDDLEQVFHLDRYSHKLTNQKEIDRERKANYTLLVQATNNCSKQPPAPIYAAGKTATGSGGGQPQQVGSASSLLGDQQSSHRHKRWAKFITEPQAATISKRSSTGNLTKAESAKLVAPTSGGQREDLLNVAAMDALLLADKSLLKVFIKVKDVNDNAPKFTQRVYTGGITTEADFGTVFMIVQAVDADADNQIVYSMVKPIKRNFMTTSSSNGLWSTGGQSQLTANGSTGAGSGNDITTSLLTNQRQKRSPQVPVTTTTSTTNKPQPQNQYPPLEIGTSSDQIMSNDVPIGIEGDDLFVINPQTGEISLNFDPQKHMKGYFEFEVMANDTDGLLDSAKVFIYLLRQDQRVKFVLRLTPQELRQRLNKFRSVFGNITGAIVNIDSYKYYENHDGTVDKKKTSLFLHFVNPDDNTIIDVDKVLTLIDNNIEYLDELYKEFHVLSSEAAHLPLSSSALIDPMDQIRTGLLGVSSFLALILILVIALCLNQRTRYERQLKAATVSAFGSSPLHLDPDYHSQTNLPNTNLHSQDPNPIWMNGYNEQDWMAGGKSVLPSAAANSHHIGGHNNNNNGHSGGAGNGRQSAGDEADYLSSENSDLNSLSGVNSVSQLHYNITTTATPRDSLNSSQGRVSGSGSGSTSTTNERQALCRGNGRQTPQQQLNQQQVEPKLSQLRADTRQYNGQPQRKEAPEVAGVLKRNNIEQQQQSTGIKKRSQLNDGHSLGHSTFGAFKEVTIYTAADHHHPSANNMQQQQYGQHQRSMGHHKQVNHQQEQQATSQVNKIASQFNTKQQAQSTRQQQPQSASTNNQIYVSSNSTTTTIDTTQNNGLSNRGARQRILVHANGADVNQGIIKAQQNQAKQLQRQVVSSIKQLNSSSNGGGTRYLSQNGNNTSDDQQHYDHNVTAENFETNLSKLSILNLETTEL